MRKYKRKTLQTDLGIFTHISAYPDVSKHIKPDIIRHIQVYSEPCVTLRYSEPWQIHNQTHIQKVGIFRNLAQSEPWFLQNPDIFRTRNIFMTLTYSEPRHIQNHSLFRTLGHFGKIVNILYEINTMNVFNTGVIFTSIAFILCRKSMGAQWSGGHDYPKIDRNIKQILICSQTETS